MSGESLKGGFPVEFHKKPRSDRTKQITKNNSLLRVLVRLGLFRVKTNNTNYTSKYNIKLQLNILW